MDSAIAEAQRAIQLLRVRQQAERAKKAAEAEKSEAAAAPADTSSRDESETVASKQNKILKAKASSAISANTDALDLAVSSGTASRKFYLTKQTKLLILRQKTKLPKALETLKKHGRKLGHWAWWCFPTHLEGMSEPRPKTCVTTVTAAGLVNHAPKVWRELLETICDLAEAPGIGKKVLPRIDHGRVKYFIEFWGELPAGVTPPWLLSVLKRLGPFYGEARGLSRGGKKRKKLSK